MSEQIRINRSPCVSCPYRRDVPSGIWATEEYEKILPYDNATWVQPGRVFMCHQANGCLCRGWLDVHGGELLGLRLGCAKGELDPEEVSKALNEHPATPVFASAAEAAKHGREAITRPGVKAKRMAKKIEAKRGKTMPEWLSVTWLVLIYFLLVNISSKLDKILKKENPDERVVHIFKSQFGIGIYRIPVESFFEPFDPSNDFDWDDL